MVSDFANTPAPRSNVRMEPPMGRRFTRMQRQPSPPLA
jgi:hypothetical protein